MRWSRPYRVRLVPVKGLLAGLVRCGHCGRKMRVRYRGRRRRDSLVVYYSCVAAERETSGKTITILKIGRLFRGQPPSEVAQASGCSTCVGHKAKSHVSHNPRQTRTSQRQSRSRQSAHTRECLSPRGAGYGCRWIFQIENRRSVPPVVIRAATRPRLRQSSNVRPCCLRPSV